MRLEGMVTLAAFVVMYDLLYRNYLAPTYGYMGFAADSRDAFEFVFALTATLAAFFSLPSTLQRFSDFFLWFFFAIVLVPGVITASRMGVLSGGSYALVFLMSASFVLMALITRVVSPPRLVIGGRKDFFSHRYMVLAVILALVLLIAVFNSIMTIPGMDTIYDQRQRAGEFGASRIVSYILNWTVYALIPILFAFALGRKSVLLMLLCLAGFFIVFMINGGKIVFFAAILMATVYGLFKLGLARSPSRLMLVPLVPTAFVFVLLATTSDLSPSLNFVVSQIVMRALAIQAVLVTVYADFFMNNPLTYMSHVTGISFFIDYPYTNPLGTEVGISLVGGAGFNANSSFIATDGIGSFGILGIPVISVIVSFFLVLMNMITKRKNLWFTCVVLTPFCLTAANTSFFTSFITGGGLLACILIAKFPRVSAP